ncbi:ABC transporter ATP-binding protein [Streptomyces sp. NPDC051776]|uniref:ABC transporter ATP-binding protein n=1 Tax=Streptomyces sp. NPDC051776 TaxID=3155414 RepID=UPI00342A9961
MGDLLRIEDLSVSFGGLSALEGVSLSVGTDDVLGIIGPNGAGKTTVFNAVCGFVRPTGGALFWKDRRLPWPRPHQLAGLGIARTLQGLGLFPGLTALENVMAGATTGARSGFLSALLGLPRSDRDERHLADRARTTLHDLGVADTEDRMPTELPHGVQKRVALARALVSEPELLLLDEPAAALSHTEMRDLQALITGLHERMAIVVVEHHMDLVMSVCEKVLVLDSGRAIARGTPGEVRSNPEVVAAYLGAPVGTPPPPGHEIP